MVAADPAVAGEMLTVSVNRARRAAGEAVAETSIACANRERRVAAMTCASREQVAVGTLTMGQAAAAGRLSGHRAVILREAARTAAARVRVQAEK